MQRHTRALAAVALFGGYGTRPVPARSLLILPYIPRLLVTPNHCPSICKNEY